MPNCYCCGAEKCDCADQTTDCELCRFCWKHCQCTDEMRAELRQAHEARSIALQTIRANHPDRVNKEQL